MKSLFTAALLAATFSLALSQNAISQTCAPAPSGLTSWWPAEDNTADVVGGNQGYFTNGTAFATGEVGNTFSLNGTSNAVIVGTAANLQVQQFTIEGWVQRSSTSIMSHDSQGNSHFFGFGDGGYAFAAHGNGTLLLTKIDYSEGDSATTVKVPPDLNWHHIAVTVTSSYAIFYVDATNWSSTAYSPGTYTFGYDAAIGARSDTLGNSFYGNIDEMSVYANTILTSNQIYAIFAAGPAGKCNIPEVGPCYSAPSNMVAWWKGESNITDSLGGDSGYSLFNAGYAAGMDGAAFAIGGNDSAVKIGGSNELELQNFTIEGWIQRASATQISHDPQGNGHLFGWGSGGYAFVLNGHGSPSNSLMLTKVDYSEIDSAAVITDTAWHHVAVVKQWTNVTFYLDATNYPAYGPYDPDFNFLSAVGLAIGARGDNLSNSFWGNIDELSVYNRALSGTEISNIWEDGALGKCGIQITLQPFSQTVPYGIPAIFSAQVAGSAPNILNYQWYLNGSPVGGGTAINYTNSTATGSNQIYVVVSSAYDSVQSSTVTLQVPPYNSNNVRLGYWKFDTSSFTNQANEHPSSNWGVALAPSFSGTSASFTNVDSVLIYSSTNLVCSNGTLRFWFEPNWNSDSTNAPGGVTFAQVAQNDEIWSLATGWDGGSITFDTRDEGHYVENDAGDMFFPNNAPMVFESNHWSQIALTWSATNLALYSNGVLLGTGAAGYVTDSADIPIYGPAGVLYYPTNSSALATGLKVGGIGQANGVFGQIDELETFNYPLTAQQIAGGFPTFAGGTNVMLDSDYDGRSDLLEVYVDNTATNDPSSVVHCRLGYWRFDTNSPSNWIFPEQGAMPVSSYGVTAVPSWSGTALNVGNAQQSSVTYPDVYTNGWANINCRQGTVRLWIKPNWSTSGGAPGTAPLVYLGNSTTPALGQWSLQIASSGNTLQLITASNSTTATPISHSCAFTSNQWMQIVLTYASNGCYLYTNGSLLASNTTGVTLWPSTADRSNGMVIGNTTMYATSANCQFDEIETFNYPLNSNDIYVNFHNIAAADSDLDGVPDIIQDITLSTSQPFIGAPIQVTGTIEAEQFDVGGYNVAYYAVGGSVQTNYRNSRMVINPCNDMPLGATNGAAGFCLDQTHATEWVDYSIIVLVSNAYTIFTRVAGIGSNGTFQVSFSNAAMGWYSTSSALTIPSTNWTDVCCTANLSNAPTMMRLTFLTDGTNGSTDSGAVGRFNYISIFPSLPTVSTGPGLPIVLGPSSIPPLISNNTNWNIAVQNASNINYVINSLLSSSGGTVTIADGTYYVSEPWPSEAYALNNSSVPLSGGYDTNIAIYITNNNVLLQGTNNAKLIAFDRATTILSIGSNGFGCHDIILSNLTLQGQQHEIAVPNGSTNFTTVYEAGSYQNNWAYTKCNNDGTLVIFGGTGPITTNVLITACHFTNADRAFLMQSGLANCLISNCEFTACTPSNQYSTFITITNPASLGYTTNTVPGVDLGGGDVAIFVPGGSCAFNMLVVSNIWYGNNTLTVASEASGAEIAPDGFLWVQGGGNVFVSRNILVNNRYEAVQINEGPSAVTANLFSNLVITPSTSALQHAETTYQGADGTTGGNFLHTFIGNWVYGEYNAANSAYAAVPLRPTRLNFSGNYIAFPAAGTYVYPGTNEPAGIGVNTECSTIVSLCGNTLASGSYGLYYFEAATNALVLNNDFSGAVFGGVCGLLGTSLGGLQGAQIISNKMVSGVTFNVQLPSELTNAPNWFLYRNQFLNSALSPVPPFVDPASSAIHITQ